MFSYSKVEADFYTWRASHSCDGSFDLMSTHSSEGYCTPQTLLNAEVRLKFSEMAMTVSLAGLTVRLIDFHWI